LWDLQRAAGPACSEPQHEVLKGALTEGSSAGVGRRRRTGHGHGQEMEEVITEVVNWHEENQVTAR